MKILYVETQSSGHHQKYYNCLLKHFKAEKLIGVFPSGTNFDETIKYHLDNESHGVAIIKYIKWLRAVYKIANKEKPDIIHFLYADYFYRYFGSFLKILRKYHTVATFHHVKRSRFRDISIKHICKNINDCVVHTESLKHDLMQLGIKNINQIEYPVFFEQDNKGVLPDSVDLPDKIDFKILSALGSTRYDKGLDILLESLKNLEEKFLLIIAGSEAYFTREQINNMIETYSDKVILYLQYLTDDELIAFIRLSDIIVLPYRKMFDGASGPLAEGVFWGKRIVGPSHGSLGNIINENDLGITFESENTDSLKKAIKEALKIPAGYSSKYLNYQDRLSQESFSAAYAEIYYKKGV